MKSIRAILGVFVLLYERLFSPRGVVRTPDQQSRIDQDCKKLRVYEFNACPFCVKVRMAMKRMSLPIERRDILKNKQYEEELLNGGGERQVPCLRIESDGQVQWLYESSDIVAYLEKRFS